MKRVATTKTGTEAVIGNALMACRRLCSVSLLLRRCLLLCPLRLLRRPGAVRVAVAAPA